MTDILSELNEEQIKPVLDTEGAVLVLAGAGSGKTRVLTSRIAHILQSGKATLPHILAITFTNKAAGEMKERLLSMTGEADSRWICTIHSMCVKILREFAEQAGIKSNFSIYSDAERNNVIKRTYAELDFSDEKILKAAKYHIGNAKMLGLDPDQYGREYKAENYIDECVLIYEKYNKHLKENNALDFDDLLLETLRLLRKDNSVAEYLSDKFRYILVDEFQDTNAVQYNIIKLLARKHGNLFAVGDDDQSIYGWRGAEIENILRFDKDFPEAKVYKLERNYRSTQAILELANASIKNNHTRRGKTLWTDGPRGKQPEVYQAEEESAEALFAVRKIIAGVQTGGRKFSDYAILMRINALTRPYEQEFAKYGIPFKVFGGFRFFERREIKDVLAYLRLIANPFDSEAAERIINAPRRGIGGKTVEGMYLYAQSEGLSLFDAAVDCDLLPFSDGIKAKLRGFATLIRDLTVASQNLPVNSLVRLVISEALLRSAYDDGSDDGDAKLANLDEFIASVDDFSRLNPEATLEEYLNQITLLSDTDDMDDGNYVTLATIHAVKGLEFPVVVICGLESNIMPAARSVNEGNLEEERRLMYVAITRAREELYLTRSKSRYLYGHRENTSVSPFLTELSPALGINVSSRFNSDGGGYPNARRSVYSSDEGYSPAPDTSFSSGGFAKPSLGGFAKPAAKDGKNYSVGMRVRHPKFGVGMIVSLKNGGAVVNVAFEGQGIKELSASIAPLEIIG